MDGAIAKSQQLPFATDRTHQAHYTKLQEWYQEYNIVSLLADSKPNASILEAIPQVDAKKLRLLKAKHDPYMPVTLIAQPELDRLFVSKGATACHVEMVRRLFGEMERSKSGRFQTLPSSLESEENLKKKKSLVVVLDYEKRDFHWDDYSSAKGARPIQFVFENWGPGLEFLQGFTIDSQRSLPYETHLKTWHDAAVEYAKFANVARQMGWKWERASMNFIEMHPLADESLTLITKVLNIKDAATEVSLGFLRMTKSLTHSQVYFPADGNCFLSVVHDCLHSKDKINLVIGSNQPIATYFDAVEAQKYSKRGFHICVLSPDKPPQGYPHVVLVGIGPEVTFEVVKAAELLQDLAPTLRVRVVNVTNLMVLRPEGKHPRAMSSGVFRDTFTLNKELHFNYQGNAEELQDLVSGRPDRRDSEEQMTFTGYSKENLLATPFGHMLLNSVSRFDVAIRALKAGTKIAHPKIASLDDKIEEVEKMRKEANDYIRDHGKGVSSGSRSV